MKPVIGITAPLENGRIGLRMEYVLAVRHSGGVPVVLPPQPDPESMISAIQGLLVPGGGDMDTAYYGESVTVPPDLIKPEPRERTDFEIALIKLALDKDLPILAVCYGMQLLNVVHGGNLYQDIGRQCAACDPHHAGMHHIAVAEPPFTGMKDRYEVNSSHHQAVREVGPGLDVFARADDGIIEGIVRRDRRFCIGVQWHPERITDEPVSALLIDRFVAAATTGGPRL